MSAPHRLERDAAPARVLLVCTGNVCRSPLAEALLRQWLAAAGVAADQVAVASAGTHARDGHPMTGQAAAELVRLGGSPDGFAARRLLAEHVHEADLVLTATRVHRSAAVTLAPAAVRRTFTVRELARLLADVPGAAPSTAEELPGRSHGPAERLRALPRVAARRRTGQGGPADDVLDPYGCDDATYALTTAQLEPALREIALAVAGPATS